MTLLYGQIRWKIAGTNIKSVPNHCRLPESAVWAKEIILLKYFLFYHSKKSFEDTRQVTLQSCSQFGHFPSCSTDRPETFQLVCMTLG